MKYCTAEGNRAAVKEVNLPFSVSVYPADRTGRCLCSWLPATTVFLACPAWKHTHTTAPLIRGSFIGGSLKKKKKRAITPLGSQKQQHKKRSNTLKALKISARLNHVNVTVWSPQTPSFNGVWREKFVDVSLSKESGRNHLKHAKMNMCDNGLLDYPLESFEFKVYSVVLSFGKHWNFGLRQYRC